MLHDHPSAKICIEQCVYQKGIGLLDQTSIAIDVGTISTDNEKVRGIEVPG